MKVRKKNIERLNFEKYNPEKVKFRSTKDRKNVVLNNKNRKMGVR